VIVDILRLIKSIVLSQSYRWM